jgi:vancomycin resistance protein VanJ
MNPAKRKVFRGIVVGGCWLYAVSIIGLVILWISRPQLPPFLALVGSFAPFLFVPALAVFLLAGIIRSRGAFIAGMVILTVFMGLYGSLFLPRVGRCACQTSKELRVMTFNLGLHLGRPEELLRIIEEQEADIITVQEMTSETAWLFEQELGLQYPHNVLTSGTETTGLFSRYPIVKEEWIKPAGGGRSYIQAVAEWNGEAVTIFVVHPLPPGLEWYRDTAIPIGLNDIAPQRQIEEVTRHAASTEGFVLILGDFNMGEYARGYSIIAEEFVDAYREAGWGFGFTFPKGLRISERSVPGPFTRVDYIFHSKNLYANRARVGCGGGSDHCYVLAEIACMDTKE